MEYYATRLIDAFTDAVVGFGSLDQGLTEDECEELIELIHKHGGIALEEIAVKMSKTLKETCYDDE